MAVTQWDPEFALGIKEIDEQHQELFALVNQMSEKVEEGCDLELVASTLEKLVAYTIYHFSDEEELLIYKKYPKLDQHKLQHRNLTDQVLRFKAELRRSNTVDCREFIEFLSGWLIEHTTTSDVEYAEYFRRIDRK